MRKVVHYRTSQVIFEQGDRCSNVLYIQAGEVRLSVISKSGQEAVVAMLRRGDFFGEGCLAGQPTRIGKATAASPTTALVIATSHMAKALSEQLALSNQFIAHMLARHVRIEQDVINLLFNSSEKRLARALLLLARYNKAAKGRQMVPQIAQGTLASMVGTTRSRVNFFMNKFRKLGFIDYGQDLSEGVVIHPSLLTVVLHE